MSAGTVNALDNIDYALFVSNCPGLECVSRVRAVTDTVRGPSTVTAPFLMMMPRGGARRGDEVFETHNR